MTKEITTEDVALVPSDRNWALKKEEKAQQQAERSRAYKEKVRQEKKELPNGTAV